MFTMLNYKGILNGQAKFECQLSSYRAPVVGHSYRYRTVALQEIRVDGPSTLISRRATAITAIEPCI